MLESHSQLVTLSEFYTALKNHTKKRLPLLQIRKKTIPLKSEKMITAAKNRKKSDFSIENISIENLVFFDLKNVF